MGVGVDYRTLLNYYCQIQTNISTSWKSIPFYDFIKSPISVIFISLISLLFFSLLNYCSKIGGKGISSICSTISSSERCKPSKFFETQLSSLYPHFPCFTFSAFPQILPLLSILWLQSPRKILCNYHKINSGFHTLPLWGPLPESPKVVNHSMSVHLILAISGYQVMCNNLTLTILIDDAIYM